MLQVKRLNYQSKYLVITMASESENVSCSVVSNFVTPMDYGPPGSSVHGIQAGILKWAAIPFSRRSSQPRDQTQVFQIAGRFFTI